MKTFKLSILILFLALESSCNKEVEGPKGEKGEQGVQGQAGPSANIYDFTLTFGTTATVQSYNMPQGSMYNKVTFLYLDVGYKDWVMLPYYENNPGYVPVNYIAIVDEISEKIDVRTDRGDNEAGSPWAVNNVQKYFRAVVLETNGLIVKPNVNFENYEEVREAFDL